jgi:hypothetical protein
LNRASKLVHDLEWKKNRTLANFDEVGKKLEEMRLHFVDKITGSNN